ncbi:MAG TPA: YicC family protein [Vicinamibacterales bacterium]|nr:YicC family protein [Vicinamibacterales bacterium]HOQ61681.1 YicC family protein [Vicinamibacterales bacterium]HPK71302.1 YicC family protein [Vicinamibacterales bacterium]
MIKSMTGFASMTREDDRASIGVTVRSVNHRYLDLQLRVPQTLGHLEPRLRAAIQPRVARGRVELAVAVQLRQEPALRVEINEAFTAALADAMARARQAGLVSGDLLPGDLLRFPQALTVHEEAPDLDEQGRAALEGAVLEAVDAALAELDAMRRREGALLQADLDARKRSVLEAVERIAVKAAEAEAGLRERLAARVADLAGDLSLDSSAIAQEVVRFAARSDISEELVRFRAHVQQWSALTDGPEACGRKLDFLLQEMNREVNTMGSKADGAAVPEAIIDVKAELEKMREQVQNVE